MNDKYSDGLLRRYNSTTAHYNTPEAPRMTSHKLNLLSKGIPLQLENGVIKTTDRGDLVFVNLKNEISPLVLTPDKILI